MFKLLKGIRVHIIVTIKAMNKPSNINKKLFSWNRGKSMMIAKNEQPFDLISKSNSHYNVCTVQYILIVWDSSWKCICLIVGL